MNPLAKAAAEAAKKAAQSKAGRKAIQSAAGAVSGFVAKGGSKKYGQWQGDRKQRELAYKLARQVHGQLSEAVFVGSDSIHLVVWKDGVPLAAFPAVEGDPSEPSSSTSRQTTGSSRLPQRPRARRAEPVRSVWATTVGVSRWFATTSSRWSAAASAPCTPSSRFGERATLRADRVALIEGLRERGDARERLAGFRAELGAERSRSEDAETRLDALRDCVRSCSPTKPRRSLGPRGKAAPPPRLQQSTRELPSIV